MDLNKYSLNNVIYLEDVFSDKHTVKFIKFDEKKKFMLKSMEN